VRRVIFAAGLYVLLIGAVMPFLLDQLSTVTFRGDIPPWRMAAVPLFIAGLVLIILGLATRGSSRLQQTDISKLFGYAALLNVIVAIIFISPVLLPTLEFPILITRWPGIYMVAAYTSFLVVGVLGSLGWSLMYSNVSRILGAEMYDRGLALLQFVLYQFGIYGLSVFMFWGGYTGSKLSYEGGGDALVGIVMESNVIPSALFIYTIMFASAIGVITLLSGKQRKEVKATLPSR
jgi:hypothetical protein